MVVVVVVDVVAKVVVDVAAVVVLVHSTCGGAVQWSGHPQRGDHSHLKKCKFLMAMFNSRIAVDRYLHIPAVTRVLQKGHPLKWSITIYHQILWGNPGK